jgi:NADH dehydrogenase
MNILIFGAAGFLGRSLLKILVNDNNISHITAVIHGRTLPKELLAGKINEAKIDDFLNETKYVEPYDVAICLIGKNITPKNSAKEIKESNLDTPKKIINFCRDNKIKHLIFASSINTRLTKLKGYAEHKREIEQYLVNSGVPYTIFRPALIFGSGDTGLSRIYKFIRKFPFVPVFGDGKKLEQPIYVEEAAEFFYKAALAAPENKVYEIGGLKAYSYNDLMLTMAKTLGKKIALIHLPARPVYLLLHFLEGLNLRLPANSEQIAHIDTDLDINNGPALNTYRVALRSFEEWLHVY